MKSAIPVTAVFDIGKTNKKFFLFDKEYGIVQNNQIKLVETIDNDGDSCEDLEALEQWIQQNIREAKRNTEVDIRALNFSTYGASLVHLDEKGQSVTTLYNYLKPYPEDLLSRFYNCYKGKKEFSLETASPPMGMLNSGLQLYWLKYEKPESFQKIRTSLHFPQYLSYLMTGEKVSELTSIGCHTAMWNYEENDYHDWLKKESLLPLLPDVQPVKTTFPVTWDGDTVQTGIGIHDSSAALAPYLYALDDSFMLVSTGTWSITFNPFNKQPLTYNELQRDCLCYIDVYGNQVKASRLFLGNEYSKQLQKLKHHFNITGDREPVELDAELIKKLIKENDSSRKLKLEEAFNSGPYPQDKPGNWQIGAFHSYKEAYHQLMLDLVAIQAESIKLADGTTESSKLIVTGGFSHNDFFVRLLACFFPQKEIYTSALPYASALGAAIMVNENGAYRQDKNETVRLLGLKKHKPCRTPEVGVYNWKDSVLH